MTSELPGHSVSVTGVVQRPDGRILAIKRADDSRWVPPGGVLELAETPEQGLVREVLQETGVRIKPEMLTGVYKNMKLGVVTLAFRCHVIEGQGHPTAEATEVAWFSLADVQAKMPEARGIRVLDALRSDGPFVRVHDGTQLI